MPMAVNVSQSQNASRPKTSIDSALANRPIAQNSTDVHPTSWAMFSSDGT